MRVYSVCLFVCVCAVIAHVLCRAAAGAEGGWLLPTAEQSFMSWALSASRYSYKHNMKIFQCSKHFDLFIEYAGVPLAGTGRFYYVCMYIFMLIYWALSLVCGLVDRQQTRRVTHTGLL